MTRSNDDKVRDYCVEHGLTFKLWEQHPADVDTGPSPYPVGTAGAESWPKAQKLRRKILADIRAAARGAKT
jgi:hypothetical protein